MTEIWRGSKKGRGVWVGYPQKNVKSEDVGDFRIIKTRQKHEHGEAPFYNVVVWDDYTCLTRVEDLTEAAADRLFEDLLPTLAVEMAKRAFGIRSVQL